MLIFHRSVERRKKESGTLRATKQFDVEDM